MADTAVVLAASSATIGTALLWIAAGLTAALLIVGLVLVARPRKKKPPAPVERTTSFDGFVTAADRLALESAQPAERPRGRWLIVPVTIVVLVAAGGGMTLLQRGRTTTDTQRTLCPDTTLEVSAAPEIAPVVEEAARSLAGPDESACGPIHVTAEDPSAVAQAARRPDVWIPSSSAWLKIAETRGTTYDARGETVACSPVVLAAPKAIAPMIVKDGHGSWAALVDGVAKKRIPASSMPDPTHNTVGMLSVFAVHAAMKRTTPDSGIAQLRALTLRSRLKDPNADPAVLLTRTADMKDDARAASEIGFFPTTEQQLRAYAKADRGVELTGVVPADAVVEADYPFAVARSSTRKDLADQLHAAIKPAAIKAAGFRTEKTPRAMTLPEEPQELLGPSLNWSQYRTLPFQVLLLIDGSGSMNQKVTDKSGRTTTRAALLRESGTNANALFGEDTSIGMWFFSAPTPESPAHTEAVPLGPLAEEIGGVTRRQAMGAAIAGYKAENDAGTPLYRTVLDGVAAMRSQEKAGAVNLVIVLTDGRDEESSFEMTQQEFLTKLKQEQDPAKPVPIIAVGYGGDADMNALTTMADATGGKAISATDPADMASAIAQAFLAAHAPK
ncbi:substrate-binding domain-containing protein [Winogradskya humida]|uniref:VWFA domain-containing protein n=1 Tax=Winogradskya humida TaxID=113566 RepID=A0ABQ4A1D7_9ACTN|nr:substrate-binding domain-containing protein [Actinoplanes humidus]GIE24658.1 hypothetical protein Ahu01nite_077600 [Actinoplanes humidus]